MLTPYERETIILFNDSDELGSIYTCSPRVYRRLIKAGLKPIREEGSAYWFEIDKTCVRLKVGNTTSRIGGYKRKAKGNDNLETGGNLNG